MQRRKLKAGEWWCLMPPKRGRDSKDTPLLVKDPGPYFESNALSTGKRIAVVRIVEVPAEGKSE